MTDRRSRRHQAPVFLCAFAAAYRCPDCLNETTEPVRDDADMWHIEVRHDDTCPTYRRLQAEGRAT